MSILGALAAVALLPGPADAGPGRLVEACQAAVSVHASAVVLRFDEASQQGAEVRLRFDFANGGETHGGAARCLFLLAPPHGAPPSLVDLDITGGVTPGRFLQSHHAVWRFFNGEPKPVAGSAPGESEPPADPRRDRPRRQQRPMFGAVP